MAMLASAYPAVQGPLASWPYWYALLTFTVLGAVFVVVAIVIHRSKRTGVARLRGQLGHLALGIVWILATVMALPKEEALRGELLKLLPIVISAAIALASTTILGNILAGATLRGIRDLRIGAFIRVGEHFGRVTERGLTHTEIQTADRDLTTIPNLFLAATPLTVFRPSGTIVSAEVSLGYDVPHGRAEECLLEAAQKTSLEEPFVHVLGLGDYAVTYRVAGLLTDVKRILSARSLLRKEMLDCLHGGGIEIVSPTFMNTRAEVGEVVPAPDAAPARAPLPNDAPAERLVFDKADEAELLVLKRKELESLEEELETERQALKRADEAGRRPLELRIARHEARRDALALELRRREESLKTDGDE